MIEGRFLEQPHDPHIRLRAELLERASPLLDPPLFTSSHGAGEDAIVGPEALEALRERGLLVVRLNEPLSNDAFIALGRRLGTLIPETDAAVVPYVDQGVLLNVVTSHEATHDPSIQPFAANALTLHSEGSGRSAGEQPRYIVLMCCDPGEDGAVMSTVLVSMADVAARLPAATQACLAGLRYRHGTPPPILRQIDGRPVLSFRDFRSDTLEWSYAGEETDAEALNGALRVLLAAMYDGERAEQIVWQPGLLVFIDNWHYLHGRRSGLRVGAVRRRHLKRLRIR